MKKSSNYPRIKGSSWEEKRRSLWYTQPGALPRKRFLGYGLLLCVMLLSARPEVAYAIGFGALEVDSSLNAPLRARVHLQSVTENILETLFVQFAGPQAYQRVGLPYPTGLMDLRLELKGGPEDGYHIAISSRAAVREPILELLLEANWVGGVIRRKYSLLLDPPGYQESLLAPLSDVPVAVRERPETGAIAEAMERPATLEENVEIARSPASAPERPAAVESGFYKGEFRPTQRGDTLWKIAGEVRPDLALTRNQVMQALLRANPDAFFLEGNINAMKTGQVLQIPSRDEMERIVATEALAFSQRHHEAWRRHLLSKGLPVQPLVGGIVTAPTPPGAVTGPTVDPGLEPIPDLVAPPRTAPETGGKIRVVGIGLGEENAPGTSLELPREGAKNQREILLLQEQLDSLRLERADTEDRLRESDVIRDDQNHLLQLKDEELRNLQERLRQSEERLQQLELQLQQQPLKDGLKEEEFLLGQDPAVAGELEADPEIGHVALLDDNPDDSEGGSNTRPGEKEIPAPGNNIASESFMDGITGFFLKAWNFLQGKLLIIGGLLAIPLILLVVWKFLSRQVAERAASRRHVEDSSGDFDRTYGTTKEQSRVSQPVPSSAADQVTEIDVLTQSEDITEIVESTTVEEVTEVEETTGSGDTQSAVTIAPIEEIAPVDIEQAAESPRESLASDAVGDDLSMEELEEIIDMTALPEFGTQSEASTKAAGDEARMAEINVLIAYEQYDRAAEFVNEALKEEGENISYHLKLLEIYSAMNDKEKFEEAARIFHDKVGGQGKSWQAAQEMWSKISPERELFHESEQAVLAATQRLSEKTSRSLMKQAEEAIENTGEDTEEETYGLDFEAKGAPSEPPGSDPVLADPPNAEFSDEDLKSAFDIFESDEGSASEEIPSAHDTPVLAEEDPALTEDLAPAEEPAPAKEPAPMEEEEGEISLEVEQASPLLEPDPLALTEGLLEEETSAGEAEIPDEAEIDAIHETLLSTLGEENQAPSSGAPLPDPQVESQGDASSKPSTEAGAPGEPGAETSPSVQPVGVETVSDEELEHTIAGLVDGKLQDDLQSAIAEMGPEATFLDPPSPKTAEFLPGKADLPLKNAEATVEIGTAEAGTAEEEASPPEKEKAADAADEDLEESFSELLDTGDLPLGAESEEPGADEIPLFNQEEGKKVTDEELQGTISELLQASDISLKEAGEFSLGPGADAPGKDLQASSSGPGHPAKAEDAEDTYLPGQETMAISDEELEGTISELMGGEISEMARNVVGEVASGTEEKVVLTDPDFTVTSEMQGLEEETRETVAYREDPSPAATSSAASMSKSGSESGSESGEPTPISEGVSDEELENTIADLIVSEGEWLQGAQRPLSEVVSGEVASSDKETPESTQDSEAPDDSITLTKLITHMEEDSMDELPPSLEGHSAEHTDEQSYLPETEGGLEMELTGERSEDSLEASRELGPGNFPGDEDTISMISGPSQEMEEEEGKYSEDEMDIQLDLALAYIELGDKESARKSIEDIMACGNEKQKRGAQELLKKLEIE